jgi:chromosome partitioning protein
MQKIVILNPKGGSGKTTISTNLAAYYALAGNRVALMDYDPQGCSARWIAARPPERPAIRLVKAYERKSRLTRAWNIHNTRGATHVIADTRAGTPGDVLQDHMRDAHAVLIPILPSEIDIHAASNWIENLLVHAKLSPRDGRIGVVANRVKKNTLACQTLLRFLKALEIPFITILRDAQAYVHAAGLGLGIFELPKYRVRPDLESWEPLVTWLEGKNPDSNDARFLPEGATRRPPPKRFQKAGEFGNRGERRPDPKRNQPVELTRTDRVEILQEALSRDPENVSLLQMAINTYGFVGHLATTVELATRAYRKDPLNPRNPHYLSTRLYPLGSFERGIELELEAQALGYNPKSVNSALTMLYLRTGDSEALAALLPAEFEATAIMPIDPMRMLAARDDEGLRAAIIEELEANLPGLDGRDTFRQLKLALLMDDEDLVWQHLEHFGPDDRARVSDFIAAQMFDVAWRHKYVNQRLLDLMDWYDEFSEFWDRFGPPDGCDWDGETITCAAPANPPGR